MFLLRQNILLFLILLLIIIIIIINIFPFIISILLIDSMKKPYQKGNVTSWTGTPDPSICSLAFSLRATEALSLRLFPDSILLPL